MTDNDEQYPFAVETAARMWPDVTRGALMEHKKPPVLVIEGKAAQTDVWHARAAVFGINCIQHIKAIPLDRRHHSKVDRKALRTLLN